MSSTFVLDAASTSYRIRVTAEPDTAIIERDGVQVAMGAYTALVEVPQVVLKISSDGYVPKEVVVSRGKPMPEVVRLQPVEKDLKPEKAPTTVEKPAAAPNNQPPNKTKPFGSDNLNPWESS